MNASYNLNSLGYLGDSLSSQLVSRHFAQSLFDRARSRALRRRFLARLIGHCTALRSLAHLPVGQHARRGERVVLIDMNEIVGSEGRSEDFDDRFNPLKIHNLERWIGILAARRSGAALPPVELVRGTDGYYVRDGHHRISVAKILGQLEIEAVIVN